MKKTITTGLAILLAAVFNYSFSRNVVNPVSPDGPAPITTLIINAHVTIVLVDNDQAQPQIMGKNSLTALVTFKRSGDTLVIGSLKDRNLVEAGVIYVPASSLQNIRINSGATVRTLQALQVPRLNVVVNGACYVHVANIGELNLIETEKYELHQDREERPVPANFLRTKKY